MTGFPFVSYDGWMMNRFGTVYRINLDLLQIDKYHCIQADLATTARVEKGALAAGFTVSKMSARKLWVKIAPFNMLARAKDRVLFPVRAMRQCYRLGLTVTQSKLSTLCAVCFNEGYVENAKCPCGITINYN